LTIDQEMLKIIPLENVKGVVEILGSDRGRRQVSTLPIHRRQPPIFTHYFLIFSSCHNLLPFTTYPLSMIHDEWNEDVIFEF
jgi:hypothetical protein